MTKQIKCPGGCSIFTKKCLCNNCEANGLKGKGLITIGCPTCMRICAGKHFTEISAGLSDEDRMLLYIEWRRLKDEDE